MFAVFKNIDDFKKIEFLAKSSEGAYSFVHAHRALDKTSGYISYSVQELKVYAMSLEDVEKWKNLASSAAANQQKEKALRSMMSTVPHEEVEKTCEQLMQTCRLYTKTLDQMNAFVKKCEVESVESGNMIFTSTYHSMPSRTEDAKEQKLQELMPHFVAFTSERAAQFYYEDSSDTKVRSFVREPAIPRIRELIKDDREQETKNLLKHLKSRSVELQFKIMGDEVHTETDWKDFENKASVIEKFIETHFKVAIDGVSKPT